MEVMSFAQEVAITVGAAALIGYPIVMRWLAEKAQPSRLRMLEVGKELLLHPAVPAEHKRMIDSMLDDAYNPSLMILIAVIMPCYAFLKLMRKAKTLPKIEDLSARRLCEEFSSRFIVAIAAANPAFALIAALEIAVVAIILFPFGQLRRAQDLQFGTIQTALQAQTRVFHRHAA